VRYSDRARLLGTELRWIEVRALQNLTARPRNHHIQAALAAGRLQGAEVEGEESLLVHVGRDREQDRFASVPLI